LYPENPAICGGSLFTDQPHTARNAAGRQANWRRKTLKIEETRAMKILSCAFNMDTACVELRIADGTMISIDCTAVENEIADNMYQQSELDYLIYNDPVAYAELILNGDPETYLKTVTEYKPLDS